MGTDVARERPDISLSPAEIAQFLATQPRVVVAAVDDDGPVATVGSAEFAEGCWRVTVDRDDVVARLLAADDRVCVLVDQFPTYYEIKGVVAHGRARQQSLGELSFTFTLTLDDVTSFDFSKMPVRGAAAPAASSN